MGRRVKCASVQVTLLLDEDADHYSIEVTEWRRGGRSGLAAFLDCAETGPSPTERQALIDYVETSVTELATAAIALDRGRTL